MSYKPDTGVIEESQGVALAKYLLQSGAKVVVYDPEAMENAREQLQGGVTFAAETRGMRPPGRCSRDYHALARIQEIDAAGFQAAHRQSRWSWIAGAFFRARSSKAWWII